MAVFSSLFLTISALLNERPKSEKGAAMVEYALLVVGIAVVVGGAVAILGGNIAALFEGIDLGGGGD